MQPAAQKTILEGMNMTDIISLTQVEILHLALSGAVDHWEDLWTLTHEFKDKMTENELAEKKEQLSLWSKRCDWLESEISNAKKAARIERKKKVAK